MGVVAGKKSLSFGENTIGSARCGPTYRTGVWELSGSPACDTASVPAELPALRFGIPGTGLYFTRFFTADPRLSMQALPPPSQSSQGQQPPPNKLTQSENSRSAEKSIAVGQSSSGQFQAIGSSTRF